MADILCWILVAFLLVLAYSLLKTLRFLDLVLEVIGESPKNGLGIRSVIKSDERSLSWALHFLENFLRKIHRDPDGIYHLNTPDRHKAARGATETNR